MPELKRGKEKKQKKKKKKHSERKEMWRGADNGTNKTQRLINSEKSSEKKKRKKKMEEEMEEKHCRIKLESNSRIRN